MHESILWEAASFQKDIPNLSEPKSVSSKPKATQFHTRNKMKWVFNKLIKSTEKSLTHNL
jgi:hypothetical protein